MLRLLDVGVTNHTAHVLDAAALGEHVGGEGVAGEMGVQPLRDAGQGTYGLQLAVVIDVAEERELAIVLVQDLDGGREEDGGVLYACLLPHADIDIHAVLQGVVLEVEEAQVGVGKACVHLEDEQVASLCKIAIVNFK